MTAGELRERKRYRMEHAARQSERRALVGLALMGWALALIACARVFAIYY